MKNLTRFGPRGLGAALAILAGVALAPAFAPGLLRAQAEPPPPAGSRPPAVLERGEFRFTYDARGISGLGMTRDPFGALVVPVSGAGTGRPGAPADTAASRVDRTLSLLVAYRSRGSEWRELGGRSSLQALPAAGEVSYTSGGGPEPVRVTERFRTDGHVLDWLIELKAAGRDSVTIGDLAISVPAAGPSGPDPKAIFERGFLRHQFVSGAGSFFFFTRASGAPPYLIATALPGTKLEYFTGGGRTGGRLFVHSGRSGPEVKEGTWRQAHTSLTLAPAGRPGSTARYGFRFRWAGSYAELRSILVDEGLFDMRVVPGMTVPTDLSARFALHTRAKIEAVAPEFPDRTTIRYLGEPQPNQHVYEVSFRRPGENRLTIRHDGGRETYLEFFSTEPLETLIRKRAAFLVDRQQIRDTTKWWDGVFGPYDARAGVTRTIDDPDIFLGRMVYVLTCDDPGLSKAPLLAAKNVHYPEPREIEALEYYLEHFVWGKLQRTDREEPYPYGVYGTPHWYINRSPERRAAYTDRDLNREHVWRSYDYPHVIMLYYHMYQIAKYYPQLSHYLDAAGYLERAYQTAKAFYRYPYEIYPDYYETYKWGLYNELMVLELAGVLDREGFPDRAAELRREWEKKVKYFVYDDEYPLRSEYAFDRTAFESSYALAKYGATHEMQPDERLWWDVQKQKWYSHPVVRREDSRAFMERQLLANLAVRGWLETSYYQLGSDPAMSYMAALGGWGVLDYALNFAAAPAEWLQLGYASYLSSWALMNTGTAENGYGFWFPGKQHDGAAGWQFMSAKMGSAWMGSSYPGGVQVPRGPWYYDGEIDLGFGGALRMARTVVTQDPVFGWTAYGGSWTDSAAVLSVVPRDGIRKRLDVLRPDPRAPSGAPQRLGIQLERDGFASGLPVRIDPRLERIAFTVENRTGDSHSTELSLHVPYGASYMLLQDGRAVALSPTGSWEYQWRGTLTVGPAQTRVELVRQQSVNPNPSTTGN